MDKERLNGMMEKNMLDSGKMENNTERGFCILIRMKREAGCGRKGKEYSGLNDDIHYYDIYI